MSEVLVPIQEAACDLLSKGHQLGAMALLSIIGEVAFYEAKGYNIRQIERLHEDTVLPYLFKNRSLCLPVLENAPEGSSSPHEAN